MSCFFNVFNEICRTNGRMNIFSDSQLQPAPREGNLEKPTPNPRGNLEKPTPSPSGEWNREKPTPDPSGEGSLRNEFPDKTIFMNLIVNFC
jgi:hypothetical protein